MGNGYANTVLMDELVDSIKSLENDAPGPGEPNCSTRAPVKKGVTTLLKIQKAKMEDDAKARNFIKIGSVTIGGSVACIAVIVGYLFLKVQGAI